MTEPFRPWVWRCLRCSGYVPNQHVRTRDGRLHHCLTDGYCGLIERIWIR